MRTTVTLDPDTEAAVRKLMTRKHISFKQALNDAIRAGTTGRKSVPFATRVSSMGLPTVNLDRALALAADLEDEELLRKMRNGS